MNKSELIKEITKETYHQPEVVERVVEAVFEKITAQVAAGNKVQIHGFGTFKKHLRPARSYRNPQTGESIQKGASFDARFASYEELERRVNQTV